MSQIGRRSSIALIFTFVVTMVLPADVAWGTDPREVDELRREVRQLQAELRTLHMAVAEVTELERQRLVVLSKAVGEQAGGPGAAPAPAPAPAPLASTETAGDGRKASPAPSPVPGARPSRAKRARSKQSASRARAKTSRVQDR